LPSLFSYIKDFLRSICHINKKENLKIKGDKIMKKKTQRFITTAIVSVLCMTTIASLLTGCGKKEEPVVYALTAVAENALEAGSFYAKTPEGFYKLPSGTRNYTEKELLAKEADPSRIVWFGQDDIMIPTLYKDDQLVFCTNETIPSSFVWERYKDQGYTIGISGLTANEAGRYGVAASEASLKLDSSFMAGLGEVQDEDMVIIDKVNNTTINNTKISEGGTIKDLASGKAYKVDAYVGSSYLAVTCSADTHAFSSFELYETSNYSYAQSNYVILTIPNYLRSGYYYLNGIGMVKYANVTRAEGIAGINFNSPYYLGTDADGNIITADDEITSQGPVETEGNIYEQKFYVDCTNEKMTVKVSYSELLNEINGVEFNIPDSIMETLNQKTLDVTMKGPDEQTYVFVPSNQETNTVECTVNMPLSGEWTISLKGFDFRTFTVTNTLTSGHSDTILHTGTGKATMVYYLKDSMTDGLFNISWENKDRAATVKITTPDKTEISKEKNEDAVVDEGYGYITMQIAEAKYGNYTIEIEGDELGRVRVTSEPKELHENAELEDAEIIETEEITDSEAEITE